MLVLTRKLGQSIVVEHNGETLEISVIEDRGDSVRVGMDAPLSFKILRKELVRNEAENETPAGN